MDALKRKCVKAGYPRDVGEGASPAPVRISEQAIRWNVDDIEAWREAL